MSMLGSLLNAYSGLRVAARSAEVVSQNVANAMTDGYGRREVELVATLAGRQPSGVAIAALPRKVDSTTMASRRLAQAESAGQKVRTDILKRLEKEFGLPGEKGSLSALSVALESSLVAAQSRPESQPRQQRVLFAARDLVDRLNRVAQAVQDMRMQADSEISRQVDLLNGNLRKIARLNRDIAIEKSARRQTSGLQDERQRLVDQIADIVPIRTYAREKGQIAISTPGGAVLLDGLPATFEFSKSGVITAQLNLGSGALSGLRINGREVTPGQGGGPLDGGSLAAWFNIRDRLAPDAASQLDAFARNLAERFQNPAIDQTRSAGDPGLFADAGAPFDPANETGFAGRISLNAAVDPGQGGALWRLRDGLGAASPGPSGNNSLFGAMIGALQARVPPASGQLAPEPVTLSRMADNIVGQIATSRLESQTRGAFDASRLAELRRNERAAGVNTDQEMQTLMLIEKAYAANARVISTIDAMLKKLMEI